MLVVVVLGVVVVVAMVVNCCDNGGGCCVRYDEGIDGGDVSSGGSDCGFGDGGGDIGEW